MTRGALAALLLVAACSSKQPAGKPAEQTAAAPAPAPSTPAQRTILGVVVGQTSVVEARATIERQGLTCEDASLAEMMRKAHSKHHVPAGPDGQPAAGAAMPAGHGKYLDDPALQQVRITCAGLPLAALGDGRDAPAGQTARLLLIAADAAGPVTLVAVQRTYTDGGQAVIDARATFAALEHRYGTAAEVRGEVPAPDQRLARMVPVRRGWAFGDLAVEASAVDLGGTGISVSEQLRAP